MSRRKLEERVVHRVKGEARKKVQKEAKIDEFGREILDERPLFHDLGFKPQETLHDQIRRITAQVQAETLAKLSAQNMSDEELQRVLDEEDDFEIPDDFHNVLTQYEQRGALSELDENVQLYQSLDSDGGVATAAKAEAEAVAEDAPADDEEVDLGA